MLPTVDSRICPATRYSRHSEYQAEHLLHSPTDRHNQAHETPRARLRRDLGLPRLPMIQGFERDNCHHSLAHRSAASLAARGQRNLAAPLEELALRLLLPREQENLKAVLAMRQAKQHVALRDPGLASLAGPAAAVAAEERRELQARHHSGIHLPENHQS